MQKVQTKNSNYVRDLRSKALLATNRELADDYKVRSATIQKNKEHEQRLSILEEKMDKMLNLLETLGK